MARRRRPAPELPAGLTLNSPVPNLGNSDHVTVQRFTDWIVRARPNVDTLRLVLASPTTTIRDVLDDPTAFPTHVPHLNRKETLPR
jgi:hypothetical protein